MRVAVDGLRLAGALTGAGLVTLFFSEFFFFNEAPALSVIGAPSPGAAVAGIAALWLFYIGFALVLGAALSAARSARWEALVLAGCLFGWTVEGTAVPVVYEAVPVSWFWTAVGWHMPVDVLLGVFGLAWLMRRSWVVAAAGALLLGCLWGAWTTWTWSDGARIAPEAFARYAATTGGALVLGTALLAPLVPWLWAMPRWLCGAAGLTALAFAGLTGLAHPVGAAGLSALVALTCLALSRLRRTAPPGPLPLQAAASAPLRPVAVKALALALSPLAASAVYAALWHGDLQPASEETIFFLLLLASCVFFAAICRAFTAS